MRTGIVGFEKYYNILIISHRDAEYINKLLNGNILKEKYKEELAERTSSLIIDVMDYDYERVVIMTKDIRGTADITFKALNKKNKNNNDIADIFKAFNIGKQPVL